ncbi:MAG: hypothetical protein PHQ12_06000 [Chthoniobacteraceae bacterium]|nr:hypothetical protein [Chthoniobacteraceae bacterium]
MNTDQEFPPDAFSSPQRQPTRPHTPYWAGRLCKLVRNVEQAEEMRDKARAALLEAEELFDSTLEVLHHYYSRLPLQIPTTDKALEKVNRLTAAWLQRGKNGSTDK